MILCFSFFEVRQGSVSFVTCCFAACTSDCLPFGGVFVALSADSRLLEQGADVLDVQGIEMKPIRLGEVDRFGVPLRIPF